MGLYVTTIYTIVILSMVSCGNGKTHESITSDRGLECVRSIKVIDIKGDTIEITGGGKCHLHKLK